MKGVRKKSQDPETVQVAIGRKLRRLRKELGYKNGDDFGYDNNINRSQYGKYEAGRQDMRLSTLIKIVNSMGLTIEEFFRGELE